MTDLVEFLRFLRARLDEDEALARLIEEGGHWRGIHVDSATEVAVHIERHDPARVLREVEAKRRIIKRYEQQAAKQYENAAEEDRTWTLEPVLYDLALPYADHPDYYQQEWRP